MKANTALGFVLAGPSLWLAVADGIGQLEDKWPSPARLRADLPLRVRAADPWLQHSSARGWKEEGRC